MLERKTQWERATGLIANEQVLLIYIVESFVLNTRVRSMQDGFRMKNADMSRLYWISIRFLKQPWQEQEKPLSHPLRILTHRCSDLLQLLLTVFACHALTVYDHS
jgi:hypothetical protein